MLKDKINRQDWNFRFEKYKTRFIWNAEKSFSAWFVIIIQMDNPSSAIYSNLTESVF